MQLEHVVKQNKRRKGKVVMTEGEGKKRARAGGREVIRGKKGGKTQGGLVWRRGASAGRGYSSRLTPAPLPSASASHRQVLHPEGQHSTMNFSHDISRKGDIRFNVSSSSNDERMLKKNGYRSDRKEFASSNRFLDERFSIWIIPIYFFAIYSRDFRFSPQERMLASSSVDLQQNFEFVLGNTSFVFFGWNESMWVMKTVNIEG